MKKRFVALTMTTMLSLSVLAGVSTGVQAAEAPAAKSYILAFKGQLPADFNDQVLQAGGTVERVIKEIGIVEVTSNQASFLSHIRSNTNIQAADEQLTVQLQDEPTVKIDLDVTGSRIDLDVTSPDGQPITTIPQPNWADPNQNYHGLQWDIQRVTNNFKSYEISKGDHETVVGVIDTGLDFNHPDLKANADLAGSKSFVPGTTDAWDFNGHGTHVAGSIAANGKVMGVGPNLKVRAYRVFGATGGAQQSWITDAIVAAANDGVEVINLSLGGWRWMANNLGEQGDSANVVAYQRAMQYAINKGVTVVAAAGNDSRNLGDLQDMQAYWLENFGLTIKGPSRVVPAQIPGVITVSSTNKWSKDSIAFYSNYGNPIDISAPGGDNGPLYDSLYRQNPKGNYLDKRDFMYRTLSTWPTYLKPNATSNLKGYALLHGTSMAAPKVAGIAAVIKSKNPNLTPAQVAAKIRQTANDMGKTGQDPLFGAGEANIYNALTR